MSGTAKFSVPFLLSSLLVHSQLWRPYNFENRKTGLIGLLVHWSVPVFVEVGPGPSWQARACLLAFLPLSDCTLRASTFLELR
jgi:hypothetical protein